MSLPSHFPGFARAHGRPGIRNRLVVLSVCGLNAPGARKVASALSDAVLISTSFGRGQLADDKAFHDTMLVRFATHPNSGAAIVLAPDRDMRLFYQAEIEAAGRPVAGFSLQEAGEDSDVLVASAVEAGRDLQAVLDAQARSACPVSDLVIAMECGHSDASSGMVANPLMGDLSDTVIAAGGAALFSETLEWLGTEEGLYARCATPEVAERLHALVHARHRIALDAGQDVSLGNPGPQNHEGGITTLEEKSFGAISKGGTGPIAGALAQGEAVPGPGLYLMDTPTLSPESISSMVAGGAQLVCFTTGHGNPYGSAIAPTIKVTANPETAQRLPAQIDFDASSVLAGTATRADLLPGLCTLVAEVCGGRETFAERADECDEAISRLGPSI